jgi:hypothetical protein
MVELKCKRAQARSAAPAEEDGEGDAGMLLALAAVGAGAWYYFAKVKNTAMNVARTTTLVPHPLATRRQAEPAGRPVQYVPTGSISDFKNIKI